MKPMAARVKTNEDLPAEIAVMLRNRGVDAISVFEQGWAGRTDDQVWEGIQTESRLLITADKGFADIRRITKQHHGLVLLRPDHESRNSYVELAAKLVGTLDLGSVVDAVVVVTNDRIRVRRRATE
jgi:predicted nuclease of predicted toxin-antitoxin system